MAVHKTASEIALLAPVPAEHLKSALDILKKKTKVAFGSMKWDVFNTLESHRPVDVYIYASWQKACPSVQPLWRATYTGFVKAKNGSHPDGMEFRPESTAQYALDNVGHWAIFWEIIELRPAHNNEFEIAQMIGYGKKRRYGKSFVPEGPILIRHP
jgi:hypothetical protein